MFRFNKRYFLAAVLLLAIEFYIGFFVHDNFIRPYIGDLLVVILIYCVIRSFIQASAWKTALAVLLFSYLLETLQYLHIVKWLGLEHSQVANILIGNSFAWLDIVAYTIGIVIVLGWEYRNTIFRRIYSQ